MENKEKLIKIFGDKETVAAMKACTTLEEVLAALKDKGLEITAEELKELMATVSGANKDETGVRAQSDDELEAVAGGSIYGDWCDFIDDCCEWINEKVGEKIYKGPRRMPHGPAD